MTSRINPDFRTAITAAANEVDPYRAIAMFGQLYDCVYREVPEGHKWRIWKRWDGSLRILAYLELPPTTETWIREHLPAGKMALIAGVAVEHVPKDVEVGAGMEGWGSQVVPAYIRIVRPIIINTESNDP